MQCPNCEALVQIDDRFCEECGVSLVTTASPQIANACQKCGAPPSKIDNERYCIECGFRQVEIANDTIELQPAPNLAGASDRGRRHHQNIACLGRKTNHARIRR